MTFKDKVIELLDNKIAEAKSDDEMFGSACKVFANDMKLLEQLKQEIVKIE